ncbi:hypothetical protein J4558_08715 [Leptolyngbya sp. 15MV]|nr:hypothetical protein J4558_08715 [Leptolyngbya sp. 15MV]
MDRYLTTDAWVLLNVRQLDKSVEISWPMRANLAKVEALCQQIEVGMPIEEGVFAQLIDGSDITLNELLGNARHIWYLTAPETLSRGLIAGIV